MLMFDYYYFCICIGIIFLCRFVLLLSIICIFLYGQVGCNVLLERCLSIMFQRIVYIIGKKAINQYTK